jgi:hypothetical protein
MSVSLLLAHGDDTFRLGAEVRRFADEIGAVDRVEIIPERSPDEGAIERRGGGGVGRHVRHAPGDPSQPAPRRRAFEPVR